MSLLVTFLTTAVSKVATPGPTVATGAAGIAAAAAKPREHLLSRIDERFQSENADDDLTHAAEDDEGRPEGAARPDGVGNVNGCFSDFSVGPDVRAGVDAFLGIGAPTIARHRSIRPWGHHASTRRGVRV